MIVTTFHAWKMYSSKQARDEMEAGIDRSIQKMSGLSMRIDDAIAKTKVAEDECREREQHVRIR